MDYRGLDLISFLVTYYNQEKFVSRSLESILRQIIPSGFEIIVGDDGSTDRTVEIVKEYQKKFPEKIRLFVQERDNDKKYLHVERASLNRLNILSHAKGDYVCFLDGDDEYCSIDFAQKAIDELQLNPDCSGAAHNYIIIKNTGEKVFHKDVTKSTYITLKDYINNIYVPAGTIVFRRPHEKDMKTILKYKSFDDNDITYFFLNRGKLLYKNIDIYNYYSNDESICSSTNELEMKLLNSVDYEIIKRIIKKEHSALFRRYFAAQLYIYNHKEDLFENRYQKYLTLCVKNGFSYKALCWNKMNKLSKIIFFLDMTVRKICYRITGVFCG